MSAASASRSSALYPGILFVDDEIKILRSLTRALHGESLNVFTAESGEQALRVLDDERIDVIVSDQRMPGMTGSELLSEVRRRHPDVGRIMLSGHADMSAALQAINEGRISRFLLKPVSSEELLSAINEVLDERRQSERVLDLSQLAGNVCSFEVLFPGDGPPRVRWSENARAMLALRPSEPLDSLEFLYDRVHRDDLHRVRALNEACLDGHACPLAEYRLLDDDGEFRWISQTSDFTEYRDGQPSRLLSVLKDITEDKRKDERLEYQAYHDNLTGLGNRAMLLSELEGRQKLKDTETALLFIDVDNFKLVNDSMGHAFGDWLLGQMAARLEEVVDDAGLLTRFGGDEFTLVMDADQPERVLDTAERIHSSFGKPFVSGDYELFVTASIGIAMSDRDTWDGFALLRNADTAMYAAKKKGTGKTRVFDQSMLDKASERFLLLGDMQRGLDREEFFLEYQPVVRLGDMRLAGYEALVRWNHPKRDRIMPSVFIPLAEESGLITSLGAWVMEEACRQASEFGQSPGRPFVSFNVSVHQLRQVDLAKRLQEYMARYGLDPEQIKVEITESGLMDNVELSMRVMRSIRDLGVWLQIDDFGTGYSSMRYLQRIPAQSLKVDQSFVFTLEESAENRAIVQTIVDLARSLDLLTVVEGVETPGQLALLRDMGCDYAQGFLFDKPLPPELARQRESYFHLLES